MRGKARHGNRFLVGRSCLPVWKEQALAKRPTDRSTFTGLCLSLDRSGKARRRKASPRRLPTQEGTSLSNFSHVAWTPRMLCAPSCSFVRPQIRERLARQLETCLSLVLLDDHGEICSQPAELLCCVWRSSHRIWHLFHRQTSFFFV